jgi:hypothetical protein
MCSLRDLKYDLKHGFVPLDNSAQELLVALAFKPFTALKINQLETAH